MPHHVHRCYWVCLGNDFAEEIIAGVFRFSLIPLAFQSFPERMKDAVKDFGKSAQSMVVRFLNGPFAKIGQMMPGRSLHQWNTSESTRKDGCFGRFWESALLLLWVSGVK